MSIRYSRTAFAVAFSCALQPAFAAATDEAEVLVSANRFGGRADQMTAGVSVISALDIARSSATTIPEVLAKLGGVLVRNSSGGPNWQIDLGGFGISGDQNTLVLLDGQRLNENELTSTRLTNIPMNAIERIEILRGAGAVLFGSGATGGTINIVTRAPGADGNAVALGASYGTYDTSDVRAGVEVASGAVGFMLNANRFASANYRQNNHVSDDNLEGAVSYRGTSADLRFNFGTGRQRLGLPGTRSEALLISAPRSANTPNDYSTTETWHAGVGGTYRFAENEFSAEVDFRNRQARADFTGFTMDTDTESVSFTPRLRLPHSGPGGASQLVLGVDVSRWNYRQTTNFGGLTIASQDSDAMYFQERLALRPDTHLTAGWRSQHSVDGTAAISRSNRLSAYELGLRQGLTGKLAVYARFGKSFRLATVDENGFTDTGRPLLPQESRDSQIGFEAGGGNNRLRAAWFNSDVTNEIHAMRITGGTAYGSAKNANLSPTRRTGIEIEAHGRPWKTFTVGAVFRQTHATFRSGRYDGIDVSGKEVPLVPRHTLTTNASWEIDHDRQLAATWRYVGEQRYDNDQINAFRKMSSYDLVDVKYSHKLGLWSWALSLDNLFDKRYYSYGILNGAGTSYAAYPELGRRVMLSAELKL